MDEDIENLTIELTVLREKNRVLELRINELTSLLKRHMNTLGAHEI